MGPLFSEGSLEIITTVSSLPQNSVNVFPHISVRMQNVVAKAGWLMGVEGRWIGNDHTWGGSGAQRAYCLQTGQTGHSPSSPLKWFACEIAGLQHSPLLTFFVLRRAMWSGNSKCSSCIWERQKSSPGNHRSVNMISSIWTEALCVTGELKIGLNGKWNEKVNKNLPKLDHFRLISFSRDNDWFSRLKKCSISHVSGLQEGTP